MDRRYPSPTGPYGRASASPTHMHNFRAVSPHQRAGQVQMVPAVCHPPHTRPSAFLLCCAPARASAETEKPVPRCGR